MDADDISAPHRIERQVEALALRPEIGVVATGVELSTTKAARSGARYDRAPWSREQRDSWPSSRPLSPHPTLLARASVMRAHSYGVSDDSLHTEDYELFTRIPRRESTSDDPRRAAGRLSRQQRSVSRRHEPVQVDNFVACARRHLERALGFRPKPGAHRVLVNRIDRA